MGVQDIVPAAVEDAEVVAQDVLEHANEVVKGAAVADQVVLKDAQVVLVVVVVEDATPLVLQLALIPAMLTIASQPVRQHAPEDAIVIVLVRVLLPALIIVLMVARVNA